MAFNLLVVCNQTHEDSTGREYAGSQACPCHMPLCKDRLLSKLCLSGPQQQAWISVPAAPLCMHDCVSAWLILRKEAPYQRGASCANAFTLLACLP